MHIPIVNIKTSDRLELYGILLESAKKDAIIINIHGTADNFYDNEFIWQIAKDVASLNISMLSVNNRGSYGLEVYQKSGASIELFEKCIIDIDARIAYALRLGYKKIILQWHSLGTEKIVYYMAKGKYRNKIKAIILLGFADSFGTHQQYLKKTKTNLMHEAKSLVKQKKWCQFLNKKWLAHAGVLPQSAESYINFFSPNSELSRAFPLRQWKDLKFYKNIHIPMLGVIGDQEEYTVIPTKKAMELLKKENTFANIFQLKDCDHNFTGKEKELSKIIKKFLNTI